MDNIWDILEIQPTRDVGAVKRAYARLAGKYHPEEEPEKFLQLRQAYQAALRWAEAGAEPEPEREPKNQPEERGWQLADAAAPDFDRDHAAVRQFTELYSGKQRRSAKAWMDYVTSFTFLDVMRESGFTARLLEEVTRSSSPPSKEFLTWLAIAYQYSQEEDSNGERQFRLSPGAQFEGIQSIFRIALLGPIPKRAVWNELAILISFSEYTRLNALADAGNWDEPAMEEASQHIGRYTTAYLHEKCTKQVWNGTERHPAGLRLLEHFFRRTDLPEELYRILWHKLDLKSAIFGRPKVLYSGLRELVQARVPGISAEPEENFLQLNREHALYCARIQQAPEREDEESDALFWREDVQRALRSRRFIEEQLLPFSYWMSNKTGDGFLHRLADFYTENPGLPCAEQVRDKACRALRERRVQRQNAEDRSAPGIEYYERLSLAYRPFFRHWLNTGFYTARDPESGIWLLSYLEQCLPYLPGWSQRFLPKPRTVAVSMGTVEIILHQRYMSFQVNGEPVYRPCLPWEQVREEGGEEMLYLLPITQAAYHQYEEVRQEIFRRLALTAAPGEDRYLIAACLAGLVCRIPDESDGEADMEEPLELFAENAERLYGAAWFEREGLLLLFEQTPNGRRGLREYTQIYDKSEAIAAAQRLLEEAASPENFDISLLEELPARLYILPQRAPEVVLGADNEDMDDFSDFDDGDDIEDSVETEDAGIAAEVVSEYLGQFAEGKLRRLELEFSCGNLVLVKDPSGYACFFFETGETTWYTMVSQPDIYQNAEHDEIQYIPFGMGRLAEYSVFQDAAPLMGKLGLVFMQISRGHPQTREGGHWLWSTTTNLHDAAHKLAVAKQKLAGFSPERCQKYILTKFVMSRYPAKIFSVTTGGEQTAGSSCGQAPAALIQFMQKKLDYLRLTWPDKQSGQRHLVLLQDHGRYMMAWLQDSQCSAVFCTACASLEGEAYKEETFCGRAVPAYLVHHDLTRIRSCLDLMLDDIADPSPVTDREFVPEHPHTPRPYADISKELIIQD